MAHHPSKKPIIGVTGPRHHGGAAWWFTRLAILRSGGLPIRLTPARPTPPQPLDGMVIGGGDDIDPVLYAEAGTVRRNYDRERDRFESEMIRHTLGTPQMPLLGICRGAQLLNVTLGGSLFQELQSQRHHTSHRRTLLPLKRLLVVPATPLETLLDCRQCRINSLHNQAINRVGDGLRVGAYDRDQIVQAVYQEGERFIIGVQWHPEYLPYLGRQQRLFRALVRAAGATDRV